MSASMIHAFVRSKSIGHRLNIRLARFILTGDSSQFSCNFKGISREYCFLVNEKRHVGIRCRVEKVVPTVCIGVDLSNVGIHSYRPFSVNHSQGYANIRNFTKTVFTDENDDMHRLISGLVIGERGQTIKSLKLETGLDFKVYSTTNALLVSAGSAEILKSAVEIIRQVVQRQRNLIERVLTDANAEVHQFISRHVIGKKAENVARLRSESGLKFALHSTKSGSLLVSAEDSAVLKSATERVKREVEKVRNLTAMVLTDEDVHIHNKICRHIFGKGGENIRRLTLEIGFNFVVQHTKSAGLLVFAKDAELLKVATDKLAQEVQKYKNFVISTEINIDNIKMYPNFTETVFTDNDKLVHEKISKHILGAGGQNIRRMRFENDLEFQLVTTESSVLYVVSTDAEVLKKATAKVTEEVENIRRHIKESRFDLGNLNIDLYFSETVFTDKNAHVHQDIYSMLFGEGGQNLRELQQKSGLDFEVDSKRTAIIVSASNSEVLKSAVKLIRLEVERIRNILDH